MLAGTLLLLSFLLLTQCGGSDGEARQGADDPAASPAVFDSLNAWVGRRPAEVDLWSYEPLRAELEEVLGEHTDEFVSYMQEAMPLRRSGPLLYSVGVVPDHAIPGVAYLIADPRSGRLRARGVFGDHAFEGASPGPGLPVPEAVQRKVAEVLKLEQ